MNRIDAIFFDLDGTLLDSALDFHFVINEMLAEQGKAPISQQRINQQVSNGARAMVSVAFGELEGTPTFNQLKERFLDQYYLQINKKSQLYPGVKELLSFLESNAILWGVITNKPERFTIPILHHFELTERAASIICPDHVKNSKPDPEALLLACSQHSVKPANCWYIGDHLRDIQAAKAAGMTSIGCQYGYLNAGENAADWQPDHIITSPLELIELIKKQI